MPSPARSCTRLASASWPRSARCPSVATTARSTRRRCSSCSPGLYWQYTADRATLDAIWPNIVAALEWIDHYGDADGDGFVEYRRRRDSGLVEPGLEGLRRCRLSRRRPSRRSTDRAVRGAGLCLPGALARGAPWPRRAAIRCLPIASPARRATLRERFEAQFWDDELGMYVLALDGDKKPCRVRTSNAGQVLFTGIASAGARRAHGAHAGVRGIPHRVGQSARSARASRASIRRRITTARSGRTTTR